MRICSECKKILKDDFFFCTECGARVSEDFKEVKEANLKKDMLTFIGIFLCYFIIIPSIISVGYVILNQISSSMFPDPDLLTDESYLLLNMILQDISNIFVLGLSVLIIHKAGKLKEALGLKKNSVKESFSDSFKKGLITFVCMYGAMYIINIISILLFPEISEDSTNQSLVNELIQNFPVYAFFSIAIMAPIIEELIFRFFLCKPLEQKKKWLGIIISGLFFGGIHLVASIQSNTLIDDLPSLVIYAGMGIVLGYRYIKTDNLMSNIFAHSIYNTISFIMILAM